MGSGVGGGALSVCAWGIVRCLFQRGKPGSISGGTLLTGSTGGANPTRRGCQRTTACGAVGSTASHCAFRDGFGDAR